MNYCSEHDEVVRTVRLYTEGCRLGKRSIMEPAFSPLATMSGPVENKMCTVPIKALFETVDKLGEAAETESRIDVLALGKDIAVVRVTIENWHNLSFTDYHSLIKNEDGWRIISKIFETN